MDYEGYKLVIVGSLCWFPDSFQIFKEVGFDVYYIKTQTYPHFMGNYSIFSELGFKEIDYSKNLEDIKEDELIKILESIGVDEKTIILGGGYYNGDSTVYQKLGNSSAIQLETLYLISKYLKENNVGAKTIRCFNGDTLWVSWEQIEYFAEKTKYLDILLYDNQNLMDYVLFNIPSFKNKQNYIFQVETPLKRFVKVNATNAENYLLSMGRLFPLGPKLPSIEERGINNPLAFPVAKMMLPTEKYDLGSTFSLTKLYSDRELFFIKHGQIAYGIGHFYDYFADTDKIYEDSRDILYDIEGQTASINLKDYPYPVVYGFINTASKVITYLMNGIIPIIPNSYNSFHKQLFEKEMAISLDDRKGLYKLDFDKDSIMRIKNNIANNSDLFTFDKIVGVLENILKSES